MPSYTYPVRFDPTPNFRVSTTHQNLSKAIHDAFPLSEAFEMLGPGWYLFPEGQILVVPENQTTTPWKFNWPPDEPFVAFIYRYDQALNRQWHALAGAPTRYDGD